jgi:hypothetical protein
MSYLSMNIFVNFYIFFNNLYLDVKNTHKRLKNIKKEDRLILIKVRTSTKLNFFIKKIFSCLTVVLYGTILYKTIIYEKEQGK